jgi:hypothetical protein
MIDATKKFLLLILPAFAAVLPAAAQNGSSAEHYWPQWRGPLGTGVAPRANPPLEWSESKNIRWKIALPGNGHSTPIIWGDRVFVTAAVPYGDELPPKSSDAPGAHDILPVKQRHRFTVIAINRRDGKILWERIVRDELPREGAHYTASLASNSPVIPPRQRFFQGYLFDPCAVI